MLQALILKIGYTQTMNEEIEKVKQHLKYLQDAEKRKRMEARMEARKKRFEEENKLIEETKIKLSKEYDIPVDEKFQKCWNLAWQYGQSSGFSEVEMYFDELVELIK